MKKDDRYRMALEYFEREFPSAQTELHYQDPFQLLVAVILSAQCTDKRVNMVTPALFEAYPNAASLAQATPEDVFNYIHSVSYPNSKSRHLVGMAQGLVSQFGGRVPDSVEDLQRLPGVGRKTANVIVSVVYGQPALAVDTHVFRVSNRIGLTRNSKTPLQTEQELTRYIPENKRAVAHHWLILHGRYVCTARSPHCDRCGLTNCCQHYQLKMRKNEKK
ncbi:MAG: endonuclease III [Bacteroidales bacterium]|nr:endonuclease III [Bacteroidales bacterium]